MTATVSVALCIRNGASYLKEQILSVLDQDSPPDEIVISDDNSSDESVSIALSVFKERNATGGFVPRLILLQNSEPLGVTSNFEGAIRACSGDLIALCDQDDIWHENRLRVAIEMFAANPDLKLLHSDANLVDHDGEPLGYSLFEALKVSADEVQKIHSGQAFTALLKRNLVTGATTVFRRELADLAFPFPQLWVHDEWLAVISAATGRNDVVADRLIDYRQHGANQIGVKKLNLIGKISRIFEARAERNEYLVARANLLLIRLRQLGPLVSIEKVELVEDKVAHHVLRASLPGPRWRRWPMVLREASRGRYQLFGRGWGDILRDLLQPA